MNEWEVEMRASSETQSPFHSPSFAWWLLLESADTLQLLELADPSSKIQIDVHTICNLSLLYSLHLHSFLALTSSDLKATDLCNIITSSDIYSDSLYVVYSTLYVKTSGQRDQALLSLILLVQVVQGFNARSKPCLSSFQLTKGWSEMFQFLWELRSDVW